MNFYLYPSYLEYILVALFFTFYGIYFILSYQKARKITKKVKPVFFIKFAYRFLYLSLILLAMQGPIFGEERQQVKVQGKDIVWAIDISGSMNAEDIAPSRLEKVKYELNELLNGHLQARIALLVFASEAIILSPLSKDHQIIKNIFVQSISTQQMFGQSTQIKDALEMSMRALLKPKEDRIRKRAKIIVLFTDGEDFGENYEATLNEIKRKGIHLFIVGVGSTQGSKILGATGFLKDKEGQEVVSKLNVEELNRIAKVANGKYFEISKQTKNNRNDMEKLKSSLEEIQGTWEDKREISLEANKYQYFLILALFFISIDILHTAKIIRFKETNLF
ncbi:MAG: VWA domain-containing protein [Thermonemataceae bacterium]|nr:VWA domain-containing protein [Thermonemataceae bacterium]